MSVVQDVKPRIQYVASGGETEYDFPFLVYADSSGGGSYLKVLRTRDDITATLIENTNYTIAGLDTTGGGTITLLSAAVAGDIYTLYRDVPIETFYTFATAGDFFATDVNKVINLILQVLQQHEMLLDRSLYVPVQAVVDSLSLPIPEAGKVLQWNDSGTAIENADPDGTVEESANAWDIEAASYDNLSFSTASQTTFPNGVFLKADGTKMYVLDGSVSDRIYQYTLSTPYVISTAVYDSVFFQVQVSALGFYFRSDGIKFYTMGSGTVYQYTMATPWDLSTASYDNEFKDTSAQGNNPRGLFFSSDGTKFYRADFNGAVFQYTMTTPWNVTTASYASLSLTVSGQGTSPQNFFIKPDGSKLYMMDAQADSIFQYSLPTAWSLSGASYDDVTFPVLDQETSPTGLFFKSDGSRIYTCGLQNDRVYQYSIT